jgi:hypothetical protein
LGGQRREDLRGYAKQDLPWIASSLTFLAIVCWDCVMIEILAGSRAQCGFV